ncbi:ribonucleotide reductase [Ochromonadaceae sp. CCMP2298]|nr:ribonucleotide reductase [Ochromonadaceae sp. CCMP2298]
MSFEPAPLCARDGHAWAQLRADVARFGARNSLLVAVMPTASTSQILGNNECTEPVTSNIYVRRTLAGDFIVVNRFMIQDLRDLGMWNEGMKEKLLHCDGSVASIPGIPAALKAVYKTVWEIRQRAVIDLASMNLYLAAPTFAQLSSMHFHAWAAGLKTCIYYLHTKPSSSAQKFTLDASKYTGANSRHVKARAKEEEEEGCSSCSG